MDKKYTKSVVCAAFFALATLFFVLSSTDLILKDPQPEIHNATVLISDVDGATWTNYQQGADFAAKKYHVDMTTKTLLNWKEDAKQQLAQMKTELDFGADGIVLVTEHFSKVRELVSQNDDVTEIVYSKIDASASSDAVAICYDYRDAAQKLAQEIIRTQGEVTHIYLVSQQSLSENGAVFAQTLEKSFTVDYVPNIVLDTQSVLNFKAGLQPNDVVVCMDAPSMAILLARKTGVLYGVGYTNAIIDEVLGGNIEALVCFDEYLAGYLSVKNLVDLMNGITPAQSEPIECRIITKDNLYDNESFIFPIV